MHVDHLPVVQYLIEKGASIEAIDEKDWSLLHIEAKNGHPPIVEYCIEKGANKNAKKWDEKSNKNISLKKS